MNLDKLKENEESCEIVIEWINEESKKLNNPYLWDKDNFEIQGQASLMAINMLQKLAKQLKKTDNEVKQKPDYL